VDVGDAPAPTPTPDSQAPTNPDPGGAQPPSNSTSMSTSMNIKSTPTMSSEELWRLIKSAPYPSLDVLPEFPEERQRLVAKGMVAFAAANPEAPLIDYRPEEWPPEVWEEWGPAEVAAHLEPVIKRDETVKVTLFMACLLTQTLDDQLNIALTGEPASGKSYLARIVARLFPDGEVMRIAGTTPRALIYERGTLVVPADSENGGPPRLIPLEEALEPLEEELSSLELEGGEGGGEGGEKRAKEGEARDRRRRAALIRKRINELRAQAMRLVDLEGKILVFLDQPNPELLERLRPLLSHDEKELMFTLTNKTGSGRIVTETAIVRGFPTVIFCSTKGYADEQERTRLIFLSPETSREKTQDVLDFLADKAGRGGAEPPPPELEVLRERVNIVRNLGVKEVIVEGIPVREGFKPYETGAPADIRFFEVLLRLTKAFTLLNVLNRRRDRTGALIAEPVDLEYALTLYTKIAESQTLGITPLALQLFNSLKPALQGAPQGLRRNELNRVYAESHHPLGEGVLKDLLKQLVSAGLLEEEADPLDRRFRVYKLPTGGRGAVNRGR
jgi:hypothetical protein